MADRVVDGALLCWSIVQGVVVWCVVSKLEQRESKCYAGCKEQAACRQSTWGSRRGRSPFSGIDWCLARV